MADLNSFSATDAQNVLRQVLHSVQHGGGRRRRRESRRARCPSSKSISAEFPRATSRTSGPPPNRRRTPSAGSSCMTVPSRSTSRATTGPDYRDKDDNVYDAIADLMSNGRTSRLYRALVRDKKDRRLLRRLQRPARHKYPHLFAFYAVPLPGHTNAGNGGCDSCRNRPAEERGHQRRRTENDQDPGQSQPAPRTG